MTMTTGFKRWVALATAAAAVAVPAVMPSGPVAPNGYPLVTITGTICYENYTEMIEQSETNPGPYVTLNLSEPAREEVRVDLVTQDGTAKAPDDYLPFRPLTVIIAPGGTVARVRLHIVADAEREPDEYFFVIIASVVGAKPGNTRAVVIIKDGSATPVHP